MSDDLLTPEKLENAFRSLKTKKGKYPPKEATILFITLKNARNPKPHIYINSPVKKTECYMIEGERKKLIYQKKYFNKTNLREICSGEVVKKKKLKEGTYKIQVKWYLRGKRPFWGSTLFLDVLEKEEIGVRKP